MSPIETILSRMMNEPAFAEAVFTDAEKALAEYKLSAVERAKFNELAHAQFDTLTTDPENRKSFAFAGQTIRLQIEAADIGSS